MADEPRYLDRRPGRGTTTDAIFKMPGEPEAVDEETQQRYSDEARRRFADSRADELFLRDARSRSVKLRNLCNESRRLGVDARRELGAIDTQLELLARKVSQRRARLSAAPWPPPRGSERPWLSNGVAGSRSRPHGRGVTRLGCTGVRLRRPGVR